MGALDGKTALVFGVANHNSIAWAIAQSLAAQGARLAFTYQERMEKNVRKLTETMQGSLVLPCDVQSDDELDATFDAVGKEFGGLDILIHSVAYAPTDDLRGRISHVSRAGFLTAVDAQRVLADSDGQTRRAADAGAWRRVNRRADLPWQRACRSWLQSDGHRQGGA